MSNRHQRRATAANTLIEDHAKSHAALQVYKSTLPALTEAVLSVTALAIARQQSFRDGPQDAELIDAANALGDAFTAMNRSITVALGFDPDAKDGAEGAATAGSA